MATDRNPDVMEMVEEQLRKNPDISNRDLKLKAEDIDSDIENLSARQFNARYPLQVKRRLAAEQEMSEDGGAPAATRETEGTGKESGEDEPSEETREKIFEMIEEALEVDPEVSNDELQERAAEIDPSVADLSARSFHARYPLQVKRQMTADRKKEREQETEKGETPAAKKEEVREAVRKTLLDFAKDVAGADDRGEVIDVLTSVDEYVDRVLEKA